MVVKDWRFSYKLTYNSTFTICSVVDTYYEYFFYICIYMFFLHGMTFLHRGLFFFFFWQAAKGLQFWDTGLTFLKNCQSSPDWGGRVQVTFNCQYLGYGALLTQTLWQNMLQQPLSPSKVLSFICMACLPLCSTMLQCIKEKKKAGSEDMGRSMVKRSLLFNFTIWQLLDSKEYRELIMERLQVKGIK